MKIKTIVIFAVFILALLVTIGSALALTVTSTPEDATEGKLYSYNIKVDIVNAEFTYVKALDNFVPKYTPKVDSNTGEFTWLPAAGETGTKRFRVKITDPSTREFINHDFEIKVLPVLEITEISVGRNTESLVSYENRDETESFEPGEELTFQIRIKNHYSLTEHELIDLFNTELAPTLEQIKIQENVDVSLTNFPVIMGLESIPNPFYLTAENEKVIEFKYKISPSLTDGTYNVNFNIYGNDKVLPNPGNEYTSDKGVLLKVKQNPYDVSITDMRLENDNLNDGILSCAIDKQSNNNVRIRVKLVNTGLDNEDVKVTLKNTILGVDESTIKTILKESSNQKNQYVYFNLDEASIIGEQEFTVKVYHAFTYPEDLYDTAALKITGEDCSLSFNSVSPAETSVIIKTDATQEFSVDLKNSMNTPVTYAWTINDLDQNNDNSQFQFSAVGKELGNHVVKVVVNEDLTKSKSWTVTVSNQTAEFVVSGILFNDVKRGETVTATFTVKNTGIGDLTQVKAYLSSVDDKYDAKLLEVVPSTLLAGQEVTLNLQIKVPKEGEGNIGNLKLTGFNEDNLLVTKFVEITLNPESFLTLESVKVNGKTSGELSLTGETEITVKVKNDYTEDMEDITITITILNVNGDDLEQVSEVFDLNKGDTKEVTLTFNLTDENVNEKQHTVEITVEGDGTDGTSHKVVETKTVSIDRPNHLLVIEKASLSTNILQCSERTSLQVTIKNLGISDEDDVEIRVRNDNLGLYLKKSELELNKFSSDDDNQRVSFNIIVDDVKSGNYPLTIEVYRDGELEATSELTLEIEGCSNSTNQEIDTDGIIKDLKEKLESHNSESFRGSDSYLSLLAVLVGLVFVATILAVVLLVVKKK